MPDDYLGETGHLSFSGINRCVKTLLVAGTFCVVLSATAYPGDSTFECPDDNALQLLDLAVGARALKHGFKNSASALSHVIENAKRPMDEVARRTACFNLAHDFYVDDIGGGPGSDYFGLIPPKEAIRSLRDKHPILSRCSDHTIYAKLHPVRRPAYSPPMEAVRLGIMGWVDLKLEVSDDGIVESARIVDSSNPILESGVIDHVLMFRYPKSSHYIGRDMRRTGFQVRITTDYFQIAREHGCQWDDPRNR